MKISFNRLKLKNFKSYKELDFRMDNSPGVYLMRGYNNKSPAMGGNGIGKSSLWDGLVWVLYGKSVRGLQGEVLCNWWAKSYNGEVWLDINGEEIVIKRGWSPSYIICKRGKDKQDYQISQDEIDDVLGINYQSALNSIIIGQMNSLFLELTASGKEAVFSEALNLQLWLDLAKKAADGYKVIKEDLHDLEKEEAKLKGQLLELDISNKIRMSLRWLHSRYSVLDSARRRVKRVRNRLLDNEQTLDTLLEKENALEEKKIYWSDRRMLELSRSSMINKKLRRISVLIAKERAEHKDHKTSFIKQDNGEWICGVCHSKLSVDKVDSLLRDQDSDNGLGEFRRAVVGRLEGALAETEKNIDLCCERLSEHLEIPKKEQRGLKAAIHDDEIKLKQLERDIKEASNLDNNPYREMVIEGMKRAVKLKEKIVDIDSALEEKQTQLEGYAFWNKGFKDIRRDIIFNSINYLDEMVKTNMEAFGLIDWDIKFSMDRPTKTGKISKGMTAFIKSPDNDKPIRWESWSGGETKRLALAAQFGFFDLISNSIGVDCNIEVVDEPTNYLSSEGINDLLTRLQERAQEQNKCIYLSDHRALDAGVFAGEFIVTMDDEGFSFIE